MSRVLWIGCGKAKAKEPKPAAELYTGSLFRARRVYAEAAGWPWRIVSAQYGLLEPDTVIAPYDLRLRALPAVERAAWYLKTVAMLLDELDDAVRLRDVSAELHMGREYAETLAEVLVAVGLTYSWPVKGLNQGEQMQWYSRHNLRAKMGAPQWVAGLESVENTQ